MSNLNYCIVTRGVVETHLRGQVSPRDVVLMEEQADVPI
jgi:hypothetical protein